MATKQIPIGELEPDGRNANRGTARGQRLLEDSLRNYGAGRSILLDRHGRIIAGNKTVENAAAIGLQDVIVVESDGTKLIAVQRTDVDLDSKQGRELAIADNRIAEANLDWDTDVLRSLLPEADLAQFWNAQEMADLLGDATGGLLGDEDDVPAAPAVATTQPGDLYQLGNHLLLCGDATKPADLKLLMGDHLADAVWTDPPYNVNYTGGTNDRLTIQNDSMSDAAFVSFLEAVFHSLCQVVKKGGAVYIAHADIYGEQFRAALRIAGFHLSGCLIWRKSAMVLGHSDYQWRHEPILYGWRKGSAHFWRGGRKQTTIAEFEGAPVTKGSDGSWQIQAGDESFIIRGENITVESLIGSVMDEKKPTRNAEHPTIKPVALIERQLRNSTKPDDIVLDVFAGSGSTLIAAEKLGLRARLMELDPIYCDVIVARYEQATGRKATRMYGKATEEDRR